MLATSEGEPPKTFGLPLPERIRYMRVTCEHGESILTGVKMAVKVYNRHWTVGTVDRTQQGQRDGVVTAQGDDTGERLALLRKTSLVGIGLGISGQDVVMSFLNLLQSPSVVVSMCTRIRKSHNL
jgi:hypothetical protein